MPTNRPLRVFLCHSSNDKSAVRELYKKLRTEAEDWIDPWLDKMKILPGQNWRVVIEEAVEASDIVIICISNHSINKEGFIQREIRYAYDLALEKPDGVIFLIPLRLENCEVPRGMRSFQWVDYFGKGKKAQYSNLLEALNLRHEQKLRLDAKEKDLSHKNEEKIIKEAKRRPIIQSSNLPNNRSLPQIEETVIKKKTPKVKAISVSKREPKAIQKSRVVKTLVGKKEKKIKKNEPVVETLNIKRTIKLTTAWIEKNKITLSNGMEFMRVPAGKFIMGSDNYGGYDNPQHAVDIPYDYWMARFPVTNNLYNTYAKTRGIPRLGYEWEKINDHPARHVEWVYILEYCRWLNDFLKNELPSGLIIRLPTEAEWEKAARGTDGHEYPWGNAFDKDNCNSMYSRKDDTTPVDLYSPQGDSPFGCADMSGNLWECTHSLLKPYPYKVNDGREDEISSGLRVSRGGCFSGNAVNCVSRDFYLASPSHGFRICIAPPLPK